MFKVSGLGVHVGIFFVAANFLVIHSYIDLPCCVFVFLANKIISD